MADTDLIKRLIALEAREKGVPPDVALAVVQQESRLNPNAAGDQGRSLGLFQLQEAAAIDAGIDPGQRHKIVPNIEGGVEYLRQSLERAKGNVPLALEMYNKGPVLRGKGDPQYSANVLAQRPQQGVGVDTATRAAMEERLRAIEQRPQAAPPPPPAQGLPTVVPQRGGAPAVLQYPATQPPAPGVRPQRGTVEVAPPPGAPASQAFPTVPLRDLASGQQQPKGWLETNLPSFAPAPAMPRTATGGPVAPPTLDTDLRQALGGAQAQTLPPMQRRVDPRSMDDAALLKQLGVDPAVVTQSKLYQPGMFQKALVTPESPGESLMQGPLGSVIAGARMPLDKGVQVAVRGARALGLLSDADVALTDAMIALKRTEHEQTPRPTLNVPVVGPVNPAELAGTMAVPIPGARGVLAAPTPATGLLPTIGRNVVNAAVGGAVQGAAQPVYRPGAPGTPEDAFWSQTSQQAVTGGVAGGVTGAVVAPVTAAAQKVLNGRNMATVTNEVEREALQLREAMTQTPYTAMQEVQAAATRGDKRAVNLLQSIQDAGDDWQKITQTSGGVQLYKHQLTANANYGDVARLAKPLGNVPVPQTLKAVDDAIARLQTEALPDTATINKLRELRSDLSPTTRTETVPPPPREPYAPATTQLQATEQTLTTPADTTYGRLRDVRSKMGDLITQYYRPTGQGIVGTTGIGKEGLKVLPGIQQTLENELHQFAVSKGPPELATAARNADRFYRTQVAPYHDTLLANAFKNDFSDEVYQHFIKQGKGERAQYFYDALDPKGRAAVRYGVVTEAVDAATDPVTQRLDSAKFTKYMTDRQEAQGVLFKGRDKWELDGLTNLVRHDAQQTRLGKRIPAVSSTLLPGAGFLTGGAVGGAIGGTATLGLTSAKLLLSTEPGRRFLRAASSLEPGSTAFQRRLDAVMQTLPRAEAIEATTPVATGGGF